MDLRTPCGGCFYENNLGDRRGCLEGTPGPVGHYLVIGRGWGVL